MVCKNGLVAVGAEVNRLEAAAGKKGGDYAAVAEAVAAVAVVAASSVAWVRLMRDNVDGMDPLYDVGDGEIAVKQHRLQIPVFPHHCHLRPRGAFRRRTMSSCLSGWRSVNVSGCGRGDWDTLVDRHQPEEQSSAPAGGDVALDRYVPWPLWPVEVGADDVDACKRDSNMTMRSGASTIRKRQITDRLGVGGSFVATPAIVAEPLEFFLRWLAGESVDKTRSVCAFFSWATAVGVWGRMGREGHWEGLRMGRSMTMRGWATSRVGGSGSVIMGGRHASRRGVGVWDESARQRDTGKDERGGGAISDDFSKAGASICGAQLDCLEVTIKLVPGLEHEPPARLGVVSGGLCVDGTLLKVMDNTCGVSMRRFWVREGGERVVATLKVFGALLCGGEFAAEGVSVFEGVSEESGELS